MTMKEKFIYEYISRKSNYGMLFATKKSCIESMKADLIVHDFNHSFKVSGKSFLQVSAKNHKGQYMSVSADKIERV
jgi:hypothetical protein